MAIAKAIKAIINELAMATPRKRESLENMLDQQVRALAGRKLDQADALGRQLCIDDFERFAKDFRSGYWIGDSEWAYSLAIIVGNSSAIKSYERWRSRLPFRANDVSMRNHSGFMHGSFINRERERLSVASEFPWNGLKVEVTSFNDKAGYLTACSYKRSGNAWSRKAKRRFKITHNDLERAKHEAST